MTRVAIVECTVPHFDESIWLVKSNWACPGFFATRRLTLIFAIRLTTRDGEVEQHCKLLLRLN